MTELEFKPNLVLVGAFNPAILSPTWLQEHNVVPHEEDVEVNLGIQLGSGARAPQQMTFSAGGASWLVQQDRIQLMPSDHDECQFIADLAAAVLQLLPHTPIVGVGMNLVAIVSGDALPSLDAPVSTQAVARNHMADVELTAHESRSTFRMQPTEFSNDRQMHLKVLSSPDHLAFDLNFHSAVSSLEQACGVIPCFPSTIRTGVEMSESLLKELSL